MGTPEPSQCPTTPGLRDVQPGRHVTTPGILPWHWQGAACPQPVLRDGEEVVVVVVAEEDGRKSKGTEGQHRATPVLALA